MKKSVCFPMLVLLIVTVLTAMSAWPSAVSASPAHQLARTSHVVQAGETLSRIAARYGVTTAAIQAANNIANPNRIYVGMRLQIPTGGYADSGSGVSPSPIVSSPSIASPRRSSSAGCANPYIVQPGDTLSGVAARCGVSLTSLASANKLSVLSMIFVGQRLYMPGSAGSTTITVTIPVEPSSGVTLPETGSTSGCRNPYMVGRGDTLSSIARLCGVSVASLRQWNDLITDMIWVGQSLKTRGGSSGYRPLPAATAPASDPVTRPPAPAATPEPKATPAAPAAPNVVIPPTPTPTPTPTPRIEPTVKP